MKRRDLIDLVKSKGQRYSDILGIDVNSDKDREVFKWSLASILFGAPITESSVIKTYRCFEKHRILTPEEIVEAERKGLVDILDEGSYTSYDYKTADKLFLVMGNLCSRYGGSITRLHNEASGPADLEKKLKKLGKGKGDVTVGIFLRELRGL